MRALGEGQLPRGTEGSVQLIVVDRAGEVVRPKLIAGPREDIGVELAIDT